MANITRVTTTTVPRTSGVPNDTIDAINQAITQLDVGLAEINLAGGDTMGDIVPTAAETTAVTAKSLTHSDTKSGIQTVTAAKLTESVTAGFTVLAIVWSQALDAGTAGAQFVATTSAATATTVTWTRGTSAAADTISYILLGGA